MWLLYDYVYRDFIDYEETKIEDHDPEFGLFVPGDEDVRAGFNIVGYFSELEDGYEWQVGRSSEAPYGVTKATLFPSDELGNVIVRQDGNRRREQGQWELFGGVWRQHEAGLGDVASKISR